MYAEAINLSSVLILFFEKKLFRRPPRRILRVMPTGELFARRAALTVPVSRAAIEIVLFVPLAPGAVDRFSVADAFEA